MVKWRYPELPDLLDAWNQGLGGLAPVGGVTLKNFDGGGGGENGEADPTGDGALGLIALNEMLKSTLNSGTLVEELRIER